MVEGEHYQDSDDDALVTDRFDYACGCRALRHEYHDGSVFCQVIRHDGAVLADELIAEHHP
jgi:hypothetical protein